MCPNLVWRRLSSAPIFGGKFKRNKDLRSALN